MFAIAFSAFACATPGYGAGELPKPNVDLPLAKHSVNETTVFAGGCFWCTEAIFEQLNGVSEVLAGYAGDSKEKADYKTVCAGETNHAEAIRITYDPSKITYGQLLRVFFSTHDPTTKDRQGPDTGHQYRSAVFYGNDGERDVASAYIKQLDDAKVFKAPIVTTIEPLPAFYPAEDYHQDYVKRNPNDPYVRQWALDKVKKVREKFSELTKNEK